MDLLRDLVRNVALVVLIASFIDLLLPGKKMDRYLKLIIGLFIIISVLNPVMTFLGSSQSFEVNAWQSDISGQRELRSIFTKGQEIAAVSDNAAWYQYKDRVERQIVSLVRLVPGVKEVQVDVQVERQEKAYYGAIRRVALVTTLADKDQSDQKKLVDPVELKVDPARQEAAVGSKTMFDAEARAAVKQKVREVVCDFYGLDPKNVIVTVITQNGGEQDEGKAE